jgi:1,4-dihydroxy-2-naphthoyl-CoA synthase
MRNTRGSELALACDMRFAARENAILGQIEVGAGTMNRPGFARGWGSGHLAPLGDGVSIHDFPFLGCHVVDR